MQRCLQLHERHDPSHPWHSSHQHTLAPRSTNRPTAAPASQPCGLRNVTVTAGGWPGWRHPAGPLPACRSPGRRCHGTFPITTATIPTPDRPHLADAVAEADRLTLTEPTHIPN